MVGDGDYRRSLYSLRDSNAGEQIPPTFQVVDELLGILEILRNEAAFTTDLLLKDSFSIPVEYLGRRHLSLNERSEQIIMIRILQRVPLALVDILRRR